MPRSRRGNNIHIPPGKLTGRILAAKVGVHEDTIKRWRKAGLLSFETQKNGELTIYVYGSKALAEAQKLAKTSGNLTDRSIAA